VSRRCEICGKTGTAGRSITRSGSPKYKGGIGLHTGGITKRRFNPNVQKIKIVVDGTVKRVRVCSRCLKAGKVQRPMARPSQIKRSEEKEAARVAAEAEAARLRAEAEATAEAERAAAEAEEAAREAAEEAAYAERMAKKGRGRGRRDETSAQKPTEDAAATVVEKPAEETVAEKPAEAAPPADEKPTDEKPDA